MILNTGERLYVTDTGNIIRFNTQQAYDIDYNLNIYIVKYIVYIAFEYIAFNDSNDYYLSFWNVL